MTEPRIYRLTIPVSDIERATSFYSEILGSLGERVWRNRHYFRCGAVVLACVEPGAGDDLGPDSEARVIYFAVDALDPIMQRLRQAGAGHVDDAVQEQAWGERSFYAQDPFGNRLCFVYEPTTYTGGDFTE
jgi:catechol 2,3-dioxygenase-like lactoylglutathione lyase family enzyme